MHWLVTGISGAGKGLIMKRIMIPDLRRRGVRVAVLDPLQAPDWGDVFQTSDPERFLRVVRHYPSTAMVVDEYGQWTSDYQVMRSLEWCATVARNHGNLGFFMAQRVKQIPPNVRNQCTNALVFRQQAADLDDLATMLDQPGVMAAQQLPAGTCLLVKPFQTPVKIKVF